MACNIIWSSLLYVLLGISMAASPPPPLPLPPKMEKMMVPTVPPLMTNGMHPNMPAPPLLASPPVPPASVAEMMAMVALAAGPTMAMPPHSQPPLMAPMESAAMPAPSDGKGGPIMCVQCGQAFKEQGELAAHESVCPFSNRTSGNELSPTACDR